MANDGAVSLYIEVSGKDILLTGNWKLAIFVAPAHRQLIFVSCRPEHWCHVLGRYDSLANSNGVHGKGCLGVADAMGRSGL